jgi:ribosomal-protein-alanine N-acetyltransferase
MGKGPTLLTRRLRLRPFELTDALEVQRLAGDPDIADTTLNIPHPYQPGMAEQWIMTHDPDHDSGEALTLAVVGRETGELMGAVGLTVTQRFNRAELGYWIGKPYWNRGFCTEAACAILSHAFEVMRLHRVHASHLIRNPASGRVMQKLGMVHEGRARQHAKKGETYEDLELYGILRDEWEAEERALEPSVRAI